MPSVLLVDEHLLIRLGLRKILNEEFRDLVFGEAKSADEAAVRLNKQHWDLVVLAIALPRKDGFTLLGEIRRLHPSTRVLVLSTHAEPHYVLRAHRLRADGYICKTAGRTELVRACKTVLAGNTFFENLPSPAAPLQTSAPNAALSTRENEVLLAFGAGESAGEMAAHLNLSPKTIGTYKRRILDKLGLSCTSDLVRYANKHRPS